MAQNSCILPLDATVRNKKGIPHEEQKIDEGRRYGHSDHTCGLIDPFFAASILFGYVDFYDLNVWEPLIPLSAFFCP